MTKNGLLRPLGIGEIKKLRSVALVSGEGAAKCFEEEGIEGLYQGNAESPSRFRIKIMEFLCEGTLESVVEDYRREYAATSPLVDVIVLGGDEERLLEWLLVKGKRAAENFYLNKEGELRRIRPPKPCIKNVNSLKAEPGKPVSLGVMKDVVYHDPTDILMKVNDGVYIHEIKGESGHYVMDFNKMRYWRCGGLQPDIEETLPPFTSCRDISFGASAFLIVEQGANADVMLNCSMRWTDYRLVMEVSRPFNMSNGKSTMMYNFYIPACCGKYLSPFWFNGVDTLGKSKLMDNRAYVRTLHGRQWYNIRYSGKVEKEKFEPIG